MESPVDVDRFAGRKRQTPLGDGHHGQADVVGGPPSLDGRKALGNHAVVFFFDRLRHFCGHDSRANLVHQDAEFRQARSEEHTSELQSRLHLVCRLLLEKKTSASTPLRFREARHPRRESRNGAVEVRVRLGDVLRLRKEIVHPRDRPHGRATFVGLEHLESGSGRRSGSLEIDLASLTGRKPRFYTGDIVYGYLRPYLNKVWVAEFDGLCSVDQYVYEVDRSRTEPEYVAWFMRSPFYAGQAPVRTGPGQLPRIRLEEVAAVGLELPDLGEERRVGGAITNQVAAGGGGRTAAEGQLEVADALKEALVRRAVSGEA